MNSDTMNVPDYKITNELYNENGRLLVNAVQEKTSRPVILKILSALSVNDGVGKRIEAEFGWATLQHFNHILNYRSVHRTERYHVVELEHFDGINLEEFLNNNLIPTSQAVALAKALVSIVEELQYYGIVHHDLRPAHFLINSGTNDIKLAELSSSTFEDMEEKANLFLQSKLGLHYISP